MHSTRYLIVGGGMTGDAAVKGIREHDADGSIVLVGAEQDPPYARPPLTKGLWAGTDEMKIWRGTAEKGADLRLGRRIVSVDLDERRAIDDAGEETRGRSSCWPRAAARARFPAPRASSTTARSTTTARSGRRSTRERVRS